MLQNDTVKETGEVAKEMNNEAISVM